MAGGVLTDLCLGLTESVFNGFVQIKGKGGEVSSWEMFQQHSFLSAWIFFLFLVVSSLLRQSPACLLYTSDAADERRGVDLGGRRIIKKKIF